MEPSHLKCLGLKFVDGHDEMHSNWELEPVEAEPNVTWRGYQRFLEIDVFSPFALPLRTVAVIGYKPLWMAECISPKSFNKSALNLGIKHSGFMHLQNFC